MQKSDEIKTAMQQIYQAMSKGDVDAVEKEISREKGTLIIGSDPKEWWAGFEEIHRVFGPQIKEMGGSAEIIDVDIQAYSEGPVGWSADQPKIRLVDGREFPIRATGVFHKEGTAWKLVQWHVSIGVLNEDTVGKELTV